MKYANQVIFLLSSLACLGLSTNAYSNPQSAHCDLSGNMPSVSKPGHSIKLPEPDTKYPMRIIKPSSHIDYKIVYVTPDPKNNFTIRNVVPKPGNFASSQ